MPCFKCKNKGIPINCKYCNLRFCSKCIQLEIHNCSGLKLKKENSLKNLKKELKFKTSPKIEII